MSIANFSVSSSMSSNSRVKFFSETLGLDLLVLFVDFLGLASSSKITFIIAGSPPRPKIPDFPGETTSILTSSRFAFSSSRASFVASSTVLPWNCCELISCLLIIIILFA